MKAIRIHTFGDPEVLKLEDVPDPKPSQGEVLITMQAVGVNPVDTYIRSGKYGERTFPFTPGLEASGVVDAVGAGVTKFKTGDRVYVHGSLTGTYAEKFVSKEIQVHPLPAAFTFHQGAAFSTAYSTAYFALVNRGQAETGETVLVHGASGGVGLAAVQISRALGLVVIGTAGSPEGRATVQKEGAQHVLDHHAPGYLDELMKLTQGRGVDLILEMLANENLGKDLKVMAPQGRVIVIGSRGPVTIDPRDTMGRHADIRGMSLLTISDEELTRVHEALLAIPVLRPVVGKVFSLARTAEAHEQIMQSGAHGKIVLVP